MPWLSSETRGRKRKHTDDMRGTMVDLVGLTECKHSRTRVPTASERQGVGTASENGHRQPHSARASWALTPLRFPAREGIDAGTHCGKDPMSHCHDETCDHWCRYPAERVLQHHRGGSGSSRQPKWRQSGSRIEELRTLDCGRGERGNESRS